MKKKFLSCVLAATMMVAAAPVKAEEKEVNPVYELVENIAAGYRDMDFVEMETNLQWIVSDMAVFEELFRDSGNVLSEDRKKEAATLIAEAVETATMPGDVAKSIIALRGLGYDAEKIYTEDFERIDAVKKLTDMIDSGDKNVENIYTLPYVMIALSQYGGYETEKLVDVAVENAGMWQNTEFGTDALTPMLFALAPFYDEREDVKAVLDESVEILKAEQREDGLIDGFEGYEAASTGLAICGLSAMGIDSSEVKNGEVSLIDGLMSTADEELQGFPNPFATEQGFRGLLAWLMLSEGKAMYDFSDYPDTELNLSGVEFCPVKFEVTPENATVSIEGAKEISENFFDLPEGSYTYSVSASGYREENGTITVTQEDVTEKELKIKEVSLAKKSSGRGGRGSSGTIYIKPDTKPEPEPESKPESQQEEKNQPEILYTHGTFSDVSAGAWYEEAVKYVYEKGIFGGTEKGFEPDKKMTRAMFVTVLYRVSGDDGENKKNSFTDVPAGAWYEKAVNWGLENKIISGVSDGEFKPDKEITREQIAVILQRFASFKGYGISKKADLSAYVDKDSVSDYAGEGIEYAVATGIIAGNGEGRLCPGESATRAQVATMMMRLGNVISDRVGADEI